MAFTVSALLLGVLLALGAAVSTADPGGGSIGKVDPKVEQEIKAKGKTTFWVVLRDRADTSAASLIQDRTERGRFVVDRLKSVADQSQSGLRSLLKRRNVSFKPFFIANVIEVTAGESVLREVAEQPEVSQVIADRVYEIPKPIPDEGHPSIQGIEWNIDRIRAPQVWSTFSDRGENIVIASIDTGAQYNHPALVAQYRGNLGSGNFDHNYDWFDPSRVCGNPSLTPCDNNQHGTHTMGTMVGDDGTNQIGVAPRARWITAKGCENNFCSLSALLASGQWILAPTDLSGQNPRPDLRPHIVNNSWGGGGGDQFYQSIVNQWNASGIFPVFANGNDGSSCFTSGSPGDYPGAYSAGAFDINNQIASFSSRGPSEFGGEIKPNVAAPGVSVRSSTPSNSFGVLSGTSMAAPHVAGTVALMWSKSPVLVNDINSTRAILDNTAVDTSDLACAGSVDDNNVWGEGRLDAFAAAEQSPGGPNPGTLQGTVRAAGSGAPIQGATVRVTGPIARTTTTNPAGEYSFRLPDGTYDVSAVAFGYGEQTATGVAVTSTQTTTQDFSLNTVPSHSVSGIVRDASGNPVPNASVTILNTPIPPATTSSTGAYSFASVPDGQYDVRSEGGRCTDSQTQHLVVDSNETLNFSLTRRVDGFGYFCEIATPSYIEAANVVPPLTGDDTTTTVSLPFPFAFYGQIYSTAHLSTNGNINFLGRNGSFSNGALPSTAGPNAAIYAHWDDLYVDNTASVRTDTLGTAPDRRFVVEWRNVSPLGDLSRRFDFEIVLHENGRVLLQYRNISNDAREQGSSSTVGIENQTGTVGYQYSFNEPVLRDSMAIMFRSPPAAFLEGTVTDANDGQPLAGANVRAFQGVQLKRSTITDSNGFYRMQLPLGGYGLQVDKHNYEIFKEGRQFTQPDVFVTRDYVLKTARAETSPSSLQLIVPPNQTRHRTLTLTNTGTLNMTWTAADSTSSTPGFDVPWLTENPSGGVVAQGASQPVDVVVDTTGLQPGVYGANLFIDSNSGRQPRQTIPVSLVVPAYYQAVNAGGGSFLEALGDTWSADQAYATGSFGYIGKSAVRSTTADITGTDEDDLYRFTREDMLEYRFDNLPSGIYELDVRSAEIAGRPPGKRQFDVIAENQFILPAHDISLEVGTNAADKHVFFMQVTDGALNLRFVARKGSGSPTVSAIRVRNRPDRTIAAADPWGF